ncbi:MAG: SDR family oxidoreductase [Flavobacteriales bacterium]
MALQFPKFHQHDQQIQDAIFLVTGGAGFIGSHIIDYLMQFGAKKVIALDNLCEGRMINIEAHLHNPSFQFVEADICDEQTVMNIMREVDYVSHQAALGSVPRSIKNPIATNKANIDGFLNVLWAAKECKVRRMVYASSSSVYGDHPVLPKVEHQIGNPLSPYAVSKRVNELYAEVFFKTYGLEVIGLRYFNIFGPKQNPEGPYAAVIPLFVQALMTNEAPFLNGDGLQTRDFTFVENAVQANIKALFTAHPEAAGKVYNVAVGERISVKEMYEILRNFAGSNLQAKHREDRPGDIRDSLADISAANQFLGYQPGVKMREGLKLTFDWIKQNS